MEKQSQKSEYLHRENQDLSCPTGLRFSCSDTLLGRRMSLDFREQLHGRKHWPAFCPTSSMTEKHKDLTLIGGSTKSATDLSDCMKPRLVGGTGRGVLDCLRSRPARRKKEIRKRLVNCLGTDSLDPEARGEGPPLCREGI